MMKRFVGLNLFLLAVSSSIVDAYVIRSDIHPDLKQFAEAQLGKLLDIRFVIESKAQDASNNMPLQGPLVKLMDKVADMKNSVMPVANGPRRHLSTGAKSLDIVKDGFVIDMNGMKTIPFQNGSWEMTWKDGQRHGSLVCAFDLPEEVARNHASLPACHVYSQFLVWTKEGLLQDQGKRRLMEGKLSQYAEDKNEALTKYRETSNLFGKFKHMHAVMQSMENRLNLPRVSHIPLDDSELLELENGLILAKKGNVWTTSRNKQLLGMEKPIKLGHATVNLISPDTAAADV